MLGSWPCRASCNMHCIASIVPLRTTLWTPASSSSGTGVGGNAVLGPRPCLASDVLCDLRRALDPPQVSVSPSSP